MSADPLSNTASGVRSGYAKSGKRRFEILDAAMRLFAEHGYTATSSRDVAESAGISEAGLRHHFPTKTDLLQGVLALREDMDLAATEENPTAAATLRRLLEIIDKNSRQRHVVELYVALSAEATSPNHPAHAYFVDRYTWVESLLVSVGEELQASGLLRADITPRSFAVELVAYTDGLQLQWLLLPHTDMIGGVRNYIDRQLTRPLRELGTGPTGD
jgi:AcrR family transcriptional regulator